jgi:hypothetical protein
MGGGQQEAGGQREGGAGGREEAPAAAPVVAVLFAGCGWMFPFEFGAAKLFQRVLDDAACVWGGCSAGAVSAAALALRLDIDALLEEALTAYGACRYWPFSMCGNAKRVMQTVAHDDDAWRRASGRLHVGLTRFPSMAPVVVSEYRDAAHGHEAIRATCHLPIVGGLLPYPLDGARYYDGGVSMVVPRVPEAAAAAAAATSSTVPITVDGRPTCQGIDVTPGFHVPLAWSYLPRKPHVLRLLFVLGYLRAAEFLTLNHARFRHAMQAPFGEDAGAIKALGSALAAKTARRRAR